MLRPTALHNSYRFGNESANRQFSITRCALVTCSIVGAFGAVPHANAEVKVVPPYVVDFEGFTLGNVHGQQGWTVEQGKAEVVTEKAYAGKQALRLSPSDPFAQAKLSLDPGNMPSPVMFLDFQLLPVATLLPKGGPGADELLDVDGARIGLFRISEESEVASLWVFNGDGAGGGSWVETPASIKVEAATGKAVEWTRISLRQDFTRQSWDLWVGGVFSAANLGFQENPITSTTAYILLGDASQPIFLDQLSIQAKNPIAKDEDVDGIPDEVEVTLGSNPAVDDRDKQSANDAGKTVLEAFMQHVGGASSETESLASVTAPLNSHASGLYNDPFMLTLSTREGFQICYTTDGSDPSVSTTKIASGTSELKIKIEKSTLLRACSVDSLGKSSPTLTAAYLFPNQILNQKRPDAVPASVRDITYWNSLPQDFSIPFELHGGDDLEVKAEFRKALEAAPIVVIAAPLETWFDAKTGIYANSSKKGAEWKRSATVHAIGVDHSLRSAEAAVSISGSTSRFHDVSLKHSLRLSFGGAGVDLAPIFGKNRFPASELVLRNPTHDSWTVGSRWQGNQNSAKYLSDAWANAWLGEQGHFSLHRRFVHVFLNEVYWGVFESIEQEDDHYLSHHAGEPATAKTLNAEGMTDLLESGGKGGTFAIRGDTSAWDQLKSEATTAVRLTLAGKPVDWEHIRSQVDVPNLIDYVLWNCWLSNLDWPNHNYLMMRVGGVWRFLSWDAEFSLLKSAGLNSNRVAALEDAPNGPAYLFNALSYSAEFRAEVLAKWTSLTNDGGALVPSSLQTSLQKVAHPFGKVVSAELARWGGKVNGVWRTVDDWTTNVDWLKTQYLPNRNSVMAGQLQDWNQRITKRLADLPTEIVGDPPAIPNPVAPITLDSAALVDLDHDGVPDDWEEANGLNKTNPEDASQDADGDGISNWEEYALGIDPNVKNEILPVETYVGDAFGRFDVRKSRDEILKENFDDQIRRLLEWNDNEWGTR